jgi:hypothetical protein
MPAATRFDDRLADVGVAVDGGPGSPGSPGRPGSSGPPGQTGGTGSVPGWGRWNARPGEAGRLTCWGSARMPSLRIGISIVGALGS